MEEEEGAGVDDWGWRWRVSAAGGRSAGRSESGYAPALCRRCVCVSLSLSRSRADLCCSIGSQIGNPRRSHPADTHPVASPPPPLLLLLQNSTRSVRNLPRRGTESLLRVVSGADAAPASASLGAVSSRKEPPSPPTRSTCRPVQTSPRTGTVSDAVADEDEVEEEVGIITTTTG